jgi:hypothetical protein
MFVIVVVHFLGVWRGAISAGEVLLVRLSIEKDGVLVGFIDQLVIKVYKIDG